MLENMTRSDSVEQIQGRDTTIGSTHTRPMSGNFDTVIDSPNALRFVSQSFTSDGDGKKR